MRKPSLLSAMVSGFFLVGVVQTWLWVEELRAVPSTTAPLSCANKGDCQTCRLMRGMEISLALEEW